MHVYLHNEIFIVAVKEKYSRFVSCPQSILKIRDLSQIIKTERHILSLIFIT